MPRYEKIKIGDKQNRLTIIEDLGTLYTSDSNKYKAHFVLVQCDCGTIKKINYQQFKTQKTKSCGCLNRETRKKSTTKHSGTTEYPRLYRIWKDMKRRCKNPNRNNFHNYGGKGIKVCEKWDKDFGEFLKWSLDNGYVEKEHGSKMDKLSIDRIDTSKDYEPANCRWITLRENISERNRNYIITQFEYTAYSPCGKVYSFTSARKFAKEHDLDSSLISKYCRGVIKQYKGWHFTRKPIE